MKIFILSLCLFLIPLIGFSQIWKQVSETSVQRTGERKIKPNKFVLASINEKSIKDLLWKAPLESPNNRNSNVLINVMLADGKIDAFQIVEYKMMEEGLQRKFPDFKTFYGVSKTDPLRKIRIDYTINGFRAVISDGEGNTYIDPYQTGDIDHRIIYRKADITPQNDWICETKGGINKVSDGESEYRFAGDCMLRTYKLACAATGEYTTFHGGTVALGQAAIVTAFNRVNEIFEQDLGARMELVANNDQLVFTDAGSDPYTNTNGGTMLGQNQTTVDNIIGFANYDIGHVFSTGGGGVAYLKSLCNQDQSSQGISKAGGVTGQSSPINDPFWIDFVAHEVGHQYGGNHTQNNSCQRNNGTAVEPGSASTIMGYAGICAPNVQSNSDPYFHAISISEMAAHITNPNDCAVVTSLENAAPSVDPVANYTVPKSTFLVMEASATDADAGDVLTYCWEQMDNEVANMPPLSTNTGGPAFRSLNPTTDCRRYLPSIDDIISGSADTWEVLPSVTRTMDFRITVRDHSLVPGCTDEEDMTISVDGNSGPFIVTNSSVPAIVNEGQDITLLWDVSGTDIAPVNCSNVDIFMSYDGGLTYPTSILTTTPNDGTELITIPVGITTMARIMVKGSNNIFFDINDSDFEIQAGVSTFTMSLDPTSAAECNTSDIFISVNTIAFMGYNIPITLSVSGLPGGASSNFSINPLTPGNSTILTISNLSGITGISNLTITGISGAITRNVPFELTLSSPTSTPQLDTPLDMATEISLNPVLFWFVSPNAISYEYQLSSSPNGVGIIQSGTVSATSVDITTTLNSLTTYYWKVRAINSCGESSYSSERNFITALVTEICTTIMSVDTPIAILDNAQSNSFIDIDFSGTITDVNVVNLAGDHNKIGQLTVAMFSPNSSTQINLFDQICGTNNNFNLNFDDEAASGTIPCPPTSGLGYQPETSFTNFDGQDPFGVWQLGILDVQNGTSGTLLSWGLEICYEVICELTVTNTNPSGTAALMDAISCATPGSTIIIDLPAQSVIDLGSLNIIIEKNLIINSLNPIFIDYSGIGSALLVTMNNSLTLNNVEIRQVP